MSAVLEALDYAIKAHQYAGHVQRTYGTASDLGAGRREHQEERANQLMADGRAVAAEPMDVMHILYMAIAKRLRDRAQRSPDVCAILDVASCEEFAETYGDVYVATLTEMPHMKMFLIARCISRTIGFARVFVANEICRATRATAIALCNCIDRAGNIRMSPPPDDARSDQDDGRRYAGLGENYKCESWEDAFEVLSIALRFLERVTCQRYIIQPNAIVSGVGRIGVGFDEMHIDNTIRHGSTRNIGASGSTGLGCGCSEQWCSHDGVFAIVSVKGGLRIPDLTEEDLDASVISPWVANKKAQTQGVGLLGWKEPVVGGDVVISRRCSSTPMSEPGMTIADLIAYAGTSTTTLPTRGSNVPIRRMGIPADPKKYETWVASLIFGSTGTKKVELIVDVFNYAASHANESPYTIADVAGDFIVRFRDVISESFTGEWILFDPVTARIPKEIRKYIFSTNPCPVSEVLNTFPSINTTPALLELVEHLLGNVNRYRCARRK